ncbi:hypothetical protein [Nocardia sp. NPDC004260]
MANIAEQQLADAPCPVFVGLSQDEQLVGGHRGGRGFGEHQILAGGNCSTASAPSTRTSAG